MPAEFPSEAEAVRDLAFDVVRGAHIDPGEVRGFIVPEGHSLEVEDFEHLLPEPRRVRAQVKVHTVQALIDYVNRHPNGPGLSIWVNREKENIIAILNDSNGTKPGWRDDRVVLPL